MKFDWTSFFIGAGVVLVGEYVIGRAIVNWIGGVLDNIPPTSIPAMRG